MVERNNTVLMEDVKIIFRNFKGAEGQYNAEGDRNFAVLLDPQVAEAMAKDGWNIKVLKPREEGDEPQPYLPVSVGYKVRPPKIVMITSHNRTNLGEEEVEILDYADIVKTDLIVNPYHWSLKSGKSGVKAYLKTLYVTIQEDELERKYDNDQKQQKPYDIYDGPAPDDDNFSE